MNPEQRRILADLLIEWEDLYRQGTDTPAETLCKDHPELASTLARQIAALKRVAWLDKKLGDDADDHDFDPSEEPRPPKVLAGRYRLDELIATGGFAEVWRAFDQELQRIIAIKIPKKTVVGSAEAFLSEARRVARLKHPAILPVYDVGLDDGDCFFVSEFVDGGSLAHRLVNEKVSTEQVKRWIVSIADALAHAHNAGVIHRDIKPANILIDQHDRALLADFGIAQSSIKPGDGSPSLGTLRYMAPEQLAGQQALPQSDLYSLAVVLHEALTGKPSYSSSDANTLRREIAAGAVLSKDLPKQLVSFCRKALHHDPPQRHHSAIEFANGLRSTERTSVRILPAVGLLATTAAVLIALVLWGLPTPESAVAPPQPAKPPTTTQTSPSPNIVTKSFPYPLPEMNRRKWISSSSDPGKFFQYDPETGMWGEYSPEGKRQFTFRQSGLTPEHIDLADPPRTVYIRLTNDECLLSDRPDFSETGLMQKGGWDPSVSSPLPSEFATKVSFSTPRDTLEQHLISLSNKVRVPIRLNVKSLSLEGITKNQSFPLYVDGQPAHDVLATILEKADGTGRLTAVLRALEDGTTAVEITTKRQP